MKNKEWDFIFSLVDTIRQGIELYQDYNRDYQKVRRMLKIKYNLEQKAMILGLTYSEKRDLRLIKSYLI